MSVEWKGQCCVEVGGIYSYRNIIKMLTQFKNVKLELCLLVRKEASSPLKVR